MDADRERLASAMDARRIELRLRWKKVADLAGMSEANLLRIRNGEIALTPFAAAGIESALQWAKGSVDSVLGGQDARPAHPEHSPPDDELDALIAAAKRDVERANQVLADLQREKMRRESGQPKGAPSGSTAA